MKKIIFLTGTRADFGKLKSLIRITQNSENFDVHIFVTGMHMNKVYGSTVDEIYKSGFKNIYKFINHNTIENMDKTLAKTILGFSNYTMELNPDLIVVHGDRVEALAGAIVGCLNNILVAHIEGGEISGTIDELIRHSVSKLSHIHLVANEDSRKRLIQLGEYKESISIIGSPDLDLMNSKVLPKIDFVKKYYGISSFLNYSIAMFHPVTTEYDKAEVHIKHFIDSLLESKRNYILIYPNNDIGSNEILNEYKKIDSKKIKIFPSLRFEYFLTLLKFSDFIIGNSSSGIREAPFYNISTINIGSRQNNRANLPSVHNVDNNKENIVKLINKISSIKQSEKLIDNYFGNGDSDKIFFKLLKSKKIWEIKCQKQFQDIIINE